MIFGFWDIPLVIAAVYVIGVKVWAKAQERPTCGATLFRARDQRILKCAHSPGHPGRHRTADGFTSFTVRGER